jgi:hypothetical protein
VQGVETALLAGDLQAGMMAEVVYRTAYASAAGAWDLLNPAIQSSIELGHATDTTLSRSAAGQLAIEGGAGSLYAATIELGAASDTTLARSSAGVVTIEGQQVARVYAPAAITPSGTTCYFSSIPSWTTEIDIAVDSLSFNGTDNLLVTLGDSGGIEYSGYASTLYGVWDAIGGTSIASAGTTVMAVNLAAANRSLTGIARFRLLGTNRWVFTFEGSITDGTNFFFASATGTKTLSGTLTDILFSGGGGGSFDGGTVRMFCRG